MQAGTDRSPARSRGADPQEKRGSAGCAKFDPVGNRTLRASRIDHNHRPETTPSSTCQWLSFPCSTMLTEIMLTEMKGRVARRDAIFAQQPCSQRPGKGLGQLLPGDQNTTPPLIVPANRAKDLRPELEQVSATIVAEKAITSVLIRERCQNSSRQLIATKLVSSSR